MTDIRFTPIGYDQFLADIEAVARRLEEDRDWKPDYIVGIGRGGHVPGTFLSHRTGIPMLSIDHSAKVYEFAEALLVRLAGWTRDGERYLLIDDINDTGKTLAHVRTAIRDNGGEPANVRYAVLVDNVSSTQRVDYAARSIDRRVDKDWFVFPWESVAPGHVIAAEAAEDPERLSLSPKE